MTKFLLICSVALIAIACQQKPGTRPLPTAVPKATPAAGETVKYTNNCTGRYTTKVFKEDGSTELKNYETSQSYESQAVLIKEENGKKTKQITASMLYVENLVAADGSKTQTTRTDYTSIGTNLSSTQKVADNTYEKNTEKDYNLKGRNGYKFRNENKEPVDQIQKKSTEKYVYFDDGKSYYTVSHVVNGKDIMPDNFDLLTEYTETTEGNKITTQSKSTLRNPYIVRDDKGTVLEETSEYEENCTEVSVTSK